jgi:hypothetical protein
MSCMYFDRPPRDPDGSTESSDSITYWRKLLAGRDQGQAGDQEPEDDHSDHDPSGDEPAIMTAARVTTAEIGTAHLETLHTRDRRRHDLADLTRNATTCARRR